MQTSVLLLTGFLALNGLVLAEDAIEALEEQAFKQASALVDASLVRIETVGGLEQVGEVLLGTGPTSGVIVSEDGYIISSSFNFISKPSSILVTLADGRRFPARQVANDKLRLLTLLKIEAAGLARARSTPRAEIRVGQWAIALGRTFELESPTLSVGIVSAVNRIWGKAIQTDAKTSPVNYGGALVDIEGRVLGVIVPMSPEGNGETAGVEWYDGGIGFAIPMEDIDAALTRLKSGQDLLPGLLGVSFAGGPSTNVPVVVDRVRYNSPAQVAGLKPKDRIVEADGEKIARVAQLKHVMGRKYAGDSVRLTIQRGSEQLTLEPQLVGELVPYEIPFIGLLPRRDRASTAGVAVRLVIPESPAEKAGLKRGDVVQKVNATVTPDASTLRELISRSRPGDTATLTVLREGTEQNLEVTLGSLPETVVAELSAETLPAAALPAGAASPAAPADAAPGDAPAGAAEAPKTGRYTAELEGHDHSYWAFVPPNYTADASYGLMVWIHPAGDTMEATIIKQWSAFCERRGIILIGPKADQVARWIPGEAKFIEALVKKIQETYSIDSQRIFLHAQGNGTQMASLLMSRQRELYRGLALAGAPIASAMPDQEPEIRQQFYFVCGDEDRLLETVQKTADLLRKQKYPVTLKKVKGLGAKYPAEAEIDELARWADSLDRI